MAVSWLLLGAMTISCVSAEGDPVALGRSAIIGGTPTEGDPAVVALLLDGRVLCTGAVIAPRVVLTAAHCIVSPELEVFFGSDVSGEGTRIPMAGARRARAFDAESLADDLALLTLAEAAPTTVEPVPLASGPLTADDVGAALRIVGFGQTEAAEEQPVLKREGSATLDELFDRSFTYPGPQQACIGDSGGPVFMERGGREVLVGVTRSGPSGCMDYVRNTRVDVHLDDFVAPFLADAREGARTAGERCYFAEQCDAAPCIAPSDSVAITYCSPTCVVDADCPSDMACVATEEGAACRYPSPSPGAIGAPCTSDWDCSFPFCARAEGEVESVCSWPCSRDPDSCASGQRCRPLEDGERFDFGCVPTASGGCAAGGGGSGGATLVLILAFAARRRRR